MKKPCALIVLLWFVTAAEAASTTPAIATPQIVPGATPGIATRRRPTKATTLTQKQCKFVFPITNQNKCKDGCETFTFENDRCYNSTAGWGLNVSFSTSFHCLPIYGAVNQTTWASTDCSGTPTTSCTEHVAKQGRPQPCFGGIGALKQKAEIVTFCESWLDDTAAAARAAADVVDVDLARFVPKLVAERGDPAFPDDAAAAKAVREYKRFLTLKRDAPAGTPLAPPPAVDRAWHAHILDTKRYHDDCARLFGGYLHHAPTFDDAADGEADGEDGGNAPGLAAVYRATLARYRERFLAEAPADVWPRHAGTAGGDAPAALRCLVPTCCG